MQQDLIQESVNMDFKKFPGGLILTNKKNAGFNVKGLIRNNPSNYKRVNKNINFSKPNL